MNHRSLFKPSVEPPDPNAPLPEDFDDWSQSEQAEYYHHRDELQNIVDEEREQWVDQTYTVHKYHSYKQESTCEICGVFVPAGPDMTRHVKHHREMDSTRDMCHQPILITCYYCPHETKLISNMRRHVKETHLKDGYVCHHKNCYASFGSRVQIQRHMVEDHDRSRSTTCLCRPEDPFPSRMALVRHVKETHLGKKRKRGEPFECPECLKTYRERKPRDRHYYKIHSGMILCEACDNVFETDTEILDHMRTKHARDYCCFACVPPVVVKRRDSMTRHRRLKHMSK